MDKYLKYSILRYSPSEIAGEQINLGVIFWNLDNNYREFRHIKKFNRLSSFDDELNIKTVKTLLQSIKEDVEGTLISFDSFDIDDYTQFYINDFSFDTPKTMKYDDYEETVETIYKIYFRFEFEKADRPKKEDDRKIIEQIIDSQGLTFKKNQYVVGPCNDRIKYDIITDDYNIKLFDFDGKDLNKLINSIKVWAWNSMFNGDNKTVIIYRYSDQDPNLEKEYQTIINILKKSNVKFYDVASAIDFLQKSAS